MNVELKRSDLLLILEGLTYLEIEWGRKGLATEEFLKELTAKLSHALYTLEEMGQ